MAADQNYGPGPETGQATIAPETSGTGQAKEASQEPTTQSEQAPSTQTEAEESFYADFNSLPPEQQEALRPYYKQMQAAFTRKAQQLAQERQKQGQKIQAYDQFIANPVENLLRLASQYGLQLAPAGGYQQPKQELLIPPEWAPSTWEEVFGKAGEYITPKVQEMVTSLQQQYQRELAELRASVAEYKQEKISRQLDEIDPDWRQYEDEMRRLLEEIPGLAKNLSALYRAAVPMEIIQARANQAALKKYEAKTKAAKIEGSGQTRQSSEVTTEPLTFDQAFLKAKKQLGV